VTAGPRPALSWSDVRGMRAGVWGLGVEGRASLRKLAALGTEAVLVDDRPSGPGRTGSRSSPPPRAAWPRWPNARS
jgi:UDP-N-acetylmuramoylalanine--D-glutamate ligase